MPDNQGRGRPYGEFFQGSSDEVRTLASHLRDWTREAGLTIAQLVARFTEDHFSGAIPSRATAATRLSGKNLDLAFAEAVVDVCSPDHHVAGPRLELVRDLWRRSQQRSTPSVQRGRLTGASSSASDQSYVVLNQQRTIEAQEELLRAREAKSRADEALSRSNALILILLRMFNDLQLKVADLRRRADGYTGEAGVDAREHQRVLSKLDAAQTQLTQVEDEKRQAEAERDEALRVRDEAERRAERLQQRLDHHRTASSDADREPAHQPVRDADLADPDEFFLRDVSEALAKAHSINAESARLMREARDNLGLAADNSLSSADGLDYASDNAGEGLPVPSDAVLLPVPAPGPGGRTGGVSSVIAVTVPDLGESVTEAVVTRWLKEPGDHVAYDEPLVEVSTDKIDIEVPAPVAGVILPGTAALDDLLGVGAALAHIRADPEPLAVRLPPLGDGAEAESPVTWLKRKGDRVTYNEPLLKVATRNADLVLPAPATGTLTETVAASGETASARSVLGYVQPDPPALRTADTANRHGTPTRRGPYVPVHLPALGQETREATLIRWLKQEGDPVVQDEPLLEVSTDKVDTELPAPATGILTGLRVWPDETVPIGTVLAHIRVHRSFTVTMPAVSEYVQEAVVARWYVTDGELVHQDDELLAVETDVADFAVRAQAPGMVEILVEEGHTVAFGKPLALIHSVEGVRGERRGAP
ncbi:biotin/lipoyl-containing protein [Streptomyces anandii]|uniref:biotin/lipoyl-containing protein n=1 Tax=Streptomyces anandii TaxID=285454 RepID=UPI00368CDF4A